MEVWFSDGSSDLYEDKSFARGAEGEVYRSRDNASVVKLYYPSSARPGRSDQLQFLKLHQDPFLNDPVWSSLYAWPSEVVTSPRPGVRSRFVAEAVRMDHYLFEESYRDLLKSKRGTWLGRIAVAIKLARAVAHLHSNHMYHGDICPRNVMVDPVRGDAVLLDCDGIVVNGAPPSGVLGSREYLAPELVTEAQSHPSHLTDRHSLAVTLYAWLLYRHPLLGSKRHDLDPDLDDQLALGARALYIEHPSDHSNRPSNFRISAETLSPQIRSLFQRAFVAGLHYPTERPAASEWERVLVDLFDNTVPCPNPSCEQQFFAAIHPGSYYCPLCDTPLLFPTVIPQFSFEWLENDQVTQQQESSGERRWSVIGWPGRALYSWHFAGDIPIPGVSSQLAACAFVDYDSSSHTWLVRNESMTGLSAKFTSESEWLSAPVGSETRLRDGMRFAILGNDTAMRGMMHVAMQPTVQSPA
jgi:serine/threonine protein kinase